MRALEIARNLAWRRVTYDVDRAVYSLQL
jgi:hypothetical protein